MSRASVVLGALIVALAFTLGPNLGRTEPAEAIIVVCDESVLMHVAGDWFGTATSSFTGNVMPVELVVTRTEKRRFIIGAFIGGVQVATADATISNSCMLDVNGDGMPGTNIRKFRVHGAIQPGVTGGTLTLTGMYDVLYTGGTRDAGSVALVRGES